MKAENFANAVHEPMDLTKIASKLRTSIYSLRAGTPAAAAAAAAPPPPSATPEQQDGSDCAALAVSTKGNADGRPAPTSGVEGEGDEAAAAAVPSPDAAGGSACDGGSGGGGAAPYANVPAFTKDMRLVFENVRRLWPHGSIGSDNRLTKAADMLKNAFEARWNALAPRVHSIQVGGREGRLGAGGVGGLISRDVWLVMRVGPSIESPVVLVYFRKRGHLGMSKPAVFRWRRQQRPLCTHFSSNEFFCQQPVLD